MSNLMFAGDAISGQEGKATATIDGVVHSLFYIKKVQAGIEKNKAEVKVVGKRSVGHKTSGWKGSGSITMFYITTLFRKMVLEYIKSGRDLYFTLTVTNEDPGSTVGKQTIVMYNCNLDNVMLTQIDVDAEVLEEDFNFTFEDLDILDSFGNPVI